MAETRDRGSVLATEEGIQILKDAKAAKRNYESKTWTYGEIATEAGVDAKTVSRFLNRKQQIDESKARAICQALGVEFNDVVEARSRAEVSEKQGWNEGKDITPGLPVVIPWQQVCQDMLELRRKMVLTSHPLGAAHRVEHVYVPLELVERQSKPRLEQDLNPERFSVRQQEEKTTPVTHREFFDSVLKGQSPKSQGRRIAIIGEPGAGKTTLLQEISTKVDGIPIWIDLASLERGDTPEQGDMLEEYLLHNWLKSSLSIIRQYAPGAVPNVLEPATELKQAFTELFEQEQVWLLLDGADELSAELGQPLNWVAQQLQQSGWIAKAKVVLTSRLNLWGDYGDHLSEFDTYRNLDFEPKQVEDFIDKWFAKKPDDRNKLKEDLDKSSDRIKSLVRNPLRLTLLCLTWKGVGDRLPDTKAGLYQRLVHSHYEHQWKTKPEDFAQFEDEEEKDKLNRWLGELSKIALDGKDSHFQGSRFRFRKSALTYFAKQFEQSNDLLKWSIKLGWLNQIGLPSIDEADADEPIYAFLHPTFQEYFAALAIDDYRFFLEIPHENFNHPYTSYRVFESQWREVFLLWLGQTKVSDEQKEKLIGNLYSFEDGCEKFYKYKAFFLSAVSISEFKHFPESGQIIDMLIHLSLNQDSTIQLAARAILVETDRKRVVEHLSNLLDDPRFVKTRARIAIELGRVDSGNPKAIAVLSSLLEDADLHESKIDVARELGQFSPRNLKAVTFLESLLADSSLHYFKRSFAAECLYEIDPENPKITAAFIHMLHLDKDQEWWNADGRGEIGNGSKTDFFIYLMFAIYGLERFSNGNSEVTNALMDIAVKCQIQDIRDRIILCLGKFDSTNAVVILNPALWRSTTEQNTLRIARLLGKADPGSWKVIGVFLDLLKSEDEEIRIESLRSLQEVGAKMPEAVAIYKAVPTLINLLKDPEWQYYQDDIAACLGEISSYDLDVINVLENLLDNTDEDIQFKAAIALKKVSINHKKATNLLISFLKNEKYHSVYEYEFDEASELLKKTRLHQQIVEIVRGLRRNFDKQTVKSDSKLYAFYFDIIWHCTQNMSYFDFYQAWYSKPYSSSS